MNCCKSCVESSRAFPTELQFLAINIRPRDADEINPSLTVYNLSYLAVLTVVMTWSGSRHCVVLPDGSSILTE
jgi:hypothetical protein